MVGQWHNLTRLVGGELAAGGQVLTAAQWNSLAVLTSLTHVDLRSLASVRISFVCVCPHPPLGKHSFNIVPFVVTWCLSF